MKRARQQKLWAAIAAALCSLPIGARAGEAEPSYRIEDACQSSEEWSVEHAEQAPALDEAALQFRKFQKRELTSDAAFTSAVRLAHDAKWSALGEYWTARIYLEAGMPGLAAEKFERLFSSGATTAEASLGCLGEIQRQLPARTLSDEARKHVTRAIGEDKALADNAAVLALVPSLTLASADNALREAIAKSDGIGAAYLQALQAVKASNAEVAVEALKKLTQSRARKALPAQQASFHLMRARSLYQLGRYDDAADEIDEVDAKSPQYPIAQSARGWAMLKQRDFTGLVRWTNALPAQLQRGGVKDAFLPELSLVTAAAYQELCLYPEANNTVQVYRRNYAPAERWLRSYRETAAAKRAELFPQAQAYRNGRDTSAPMTIVAEWARSSVFQAQQDWLEASAREEAAIQKGLGTDSKDSREAFRADSAKYLANLAGQRTEHRHRAEQELARLTLHLAQQLKEVDESLKLLEVETLNAASKEMLASTEPSPRLLAMAANPAAVQSLSGEEREIRNQCPTKK